MGSLSEPYNKDGWKGKLRTLKYLYLRYRYFKHIRFFLAVGREGVATYTGLGFDERYVFPWAYFINVPAVPKVPAAQPEKKRIIFGGRLEPGKGIYRFITELAKFDRNKYALDIFGSGPDEAAIKQFVAAQGLEDTIKFQPFMPYNDMVQQYSRYDWVVLPSTAKDGWGVVVSEGMLNGLKAICSSICGVSWAVKDNFNGVVIDWNNPGSCHTAIEKMLNGNNFANTTAISNWAKTAISADAGAAYYLEIIDATFNGKPKPTAPWIRN
jgi:glycosyltransferase involved in cell wall biosynthesis